MHVIYSCFHTTIAEVSSCYRDSIASKDDDIYYWLLIKKSVLNTDLHKKCLYRNKDGSDHFNNELKCRMPNLLKFPGCNYKAKQNGDLKMNKYTTIRDKFIRAAWHLKRNNHYCSQYKNATCPRFYISHFYVPGNLHIMILENGKHGFHPLLRRTLRQKQKYIERK